jgi:lipid-A-disaccharide synthase
MTKQTLYLVAAEASGDDLGARLIRSLKEKAPERFHFVGQGGHKMKALGIEGPYTLSDLSVVGFVEALLAAPRIKKCISGIVNDIIINSPKAVVLIDAWGLSIRIAKALRVKAPHIQIIKYVAPQVWATRPQRAKILADTVDGLIALHEMDRPFFETYGLKTEVVGYPAVHLDDQIIPEKPPKIISNQDLLLILPGSRSSEIKRLNSLFGRTAKSILDRNPNLQIAVIVAPTIANLVLNQKEHYPSGTLFLDEEKEQLWAFKKARCALAASGTVTTELAAHHIPVVVAYRVEALTYWLFKNLAQIKYVSLVNILGDREIMPEFIQDQCRVELLTEALHQRVTNDHLCLDQIEAQNEVLIKMGRGQTPTHEKAADILIEWIKP